MPLFGSKTVLGVDLGTAAVKIAELSRSGDRFELKNYGLLDFLASPATLSSGAKESAGLKISDDLIIGGLKDLVGRIRPSAKDAVTSISSFLTFSTVIELPYLSEKDLEKAIPFEARKYIPLPLSEVILDWSIINVREFQDHPNVEVFLAAVPKDEAERYKNIFLLSGLTLRALELENIALIRVLAGGDNSPLTIVNLGGRSSSIVIVEKGFERVSRNYETGGFEVTKALADNLKISFEKADELKKKEGLKGNQSVREIMIPLIDSIVFEVKKTIANYEESKNLKIVKVILTGGHSRMIGLKEYFSQKLGKEMIIGDPWKKVSYNKALGGALEGLGSSLSVAVGLAMRKI